MLISHTQQQISELNKAYLNGQMPYDEYRQKRALTINAIFDDITVRDHKLEKTVTMQSRVVIKDTSNTYIYLAIVVLLICLGLAITFLLKTSLPLDEKVEQNIERNIEQKEKIETLIQFSLKNNKWSLQRIKKIILLWNKLGVQTQAEYRKKIWYPALIDTLNNIVLEKKALIDLGDKSALEFEKELNSLLFVLKNENI